MLTRSRNIHACSFVVIVIIIDFKFNFFELLTLGIFTAEGKKFIIIIIIIIIIMNKYSQQSKIEYKVIIQIDILVAYLNRSSLFQGWSCHQAYYCYRRGLL